MNNVNPEAWLAWALERIQHHPAKRIHDLLPCAYQEVIEAQVDARIVKMDVIDSESTENSVNEAISAMVGLDVLFNNAGVGCFGIQELMSPDDTAWVMDVNVIGVQLVMRATLPHFRVEIRGTVLSAPSLISCIATLFYCTYSASKWALESIVECYRTELSGFGIGYCIIEPDAMPTAFCDALVTPSDAIREAENGEFAGDFECRAGPNA